MERTFLPAFHALLSSTCWKRASRSHSRRRQQSTVPQLEQLETLNLPSTGVLSVSVDATHIVPTQATNLNLYQFFGGETVDVPVTIASAPIPMVVHAAKSGVVLHDAKTTDNLKLYLSDGIKSILLGSAEVSTNIQVGSLVTDTISVTVPTSLTPGTTYPITASLADAGNEPTVQTFEYLGMPKHPAVFQEGATTNANYFDVVTQALSNTNPFTGTGTSLAGPPATTDGLHFTAAFEVNGGYDNPDPSSLTPYLVNGDPTIGIGLDLVTGLKGGDVKAIRVALAADVRAYYLANYETNLSRMSDTQIIQMLDQQAADDVTKQALTAQDAQTLYQMEYGTAQNRAITFVGSAAWGGLTPTARIALTDIAFNGIHGFKKLSSDLQGPNPDYVKAGFDLLDSKRTQEQIGVNRSLAEYEYLLYGNTNTLGVIL